MTLQERIDAARAEQARGDNLGSQQGATLQDRVNAARAGAGGADPDPWYEDFGEGIAASAMGTYYGVQDLFGRMDDEEKARLKDWQEDAAESGWGTAGNVVGELAQLAVPGAGLAKSAKVANALSRTGRAAPLVKEAVGASLLAGSKYADEEKGETRLGNVGKDLLGVGVGATVGQVLKKALKGVNINPEAKAMIDKGVELTPAKATGSGLLRATEGLMAITPGTAGATKRAREKMYGQWNKVTFNEVAPPGVTITSAGPEGMQQLYKGFNDAYDDAWAKAGRPSNTGLVSIVNQADAVGRELSGSAESVARKITRDLKDLSQNFTAKGLKSFDNHLRKSIEDAYGGANPQAELGSALKNMRRTLRESVGDDAADALKAVDKQYGKYLPIRSTTSSVRALLNEGRFDPEMMAGGMKKHSTDSQLGRDAAPMSEFLRDSLASVGKRDPTILPTVTKVLSSNLPSPDAPFQLINKMVLGQTAPQQLGVKAGQTDIGRVLREFASPGRLGAALTQ